MMAMMAVCGGLTCYCAITDMRDSSLQNSSACASTPPRAVPGRRLKEEDHPSLGHCDWSRLSLQLSSSPPTYSLPVGPPSPPHSKVRIQLLGSMAPDTKKPSFPALLTHMVKSEGVSSIYAGLSAAIMRQAIYGTARIGLHRTFSDKLQEVSRLVWLRGIRSRSCGCCCCWEGVVRLLVR